jgi:VWFA-related protein
VRALAALAIVASSLAIVAHEPRAQQPPAPPPQQTFRTGTDVVFVDVSVRENGKPVPGLTPDDFVLTDNGVRQRIEHVEATAVPIDLTLVMDVSGNPSSPWMTTKPAAQALAAIQRELDDVTAQLRPEDRVRVIAIDRYTQLLVPFSPPGAARLPKTVEHDGLSALHDTLAAALMHPVEPSRRHVVVARTKGLDTVSAVDASALRGIAEQADALFHIVMMESAMDADMALRGFQCQNMGLCFPTRRFWVPHQRRLFGGGLSHLLTPDGEAVAAGAEATGGALHKTQVILEPTMGRTFRRAFEDFRSSYVLRYTPTGVPRAGWHTIDVRVPGSRRYTVRARRGYGVDVEAPVVPTAKPASLDTLAGLVSAYGEGRYRDVVDALRGAKQPDRLLREFDEGGNPWPAEPRREAVFALELAETPAFSRTAAERERAHALLQRFAQLIRHPLEPDGFELRWHFAVLTLLEGTLRPNDAEAFVSRALARFPNEPRFLLSKAILADQRTVRSPERGAPPPPADAQSPEALFLEAAKHPPTEPEARIRLGFWLHRAGRQADALSQLDAGGATRDSMLLYLRELFRGHVLAALERQDEAADAYRTALSIVPASQAARVALMNTLLLQGDREGAEALAEQVQAESSRDLDPWWVYWQGQLRFQQAAMAALRQMVTP